jgi:tricorn protease
MLRRTLLSIALVIGIIGARLDADVNIRDTRLVHQPATSGTHVAFIYADDLWVARLDGSDVRRLTTDDGLESNPAFSPDGRMIAFTAQYEGNRDVYVVAVEGGVPKRLTWHPGPDEVQDFTPDGRKVLFTSPRAVFTGRYTQLFTVPVDGGTEEALPIPNAASGAYSPDGRRIAYNPLAPRFEQWKNYRGGAVSRIVIYDTSNHEIEKVPQPPARANDVDGAWIGSTLYFRSDRNGEFNLFSYDARSNAVTQLTNHTDFPVLNLDAGGDAIVYEQAGYLHRFDPATKSSTKITIGVPADLRETRPRFVRGANWIRNAAISPSGARAVFEFRGEILTVPAEKGDARNLTNTPGAHERAPAWSPDGSRIAYFSDASGEYELHVAAHDGKGDVKKVRLSGAGFYANLAWSPDSKKVAYTDNAQALYVLDLSAAAPAPKKIAAARVYGPISTLTFNWSPDSRWVAYTVNTQALAMTLSAYSLEQDRSFQISDGLVEVAEPVFDKSGKYLFVFGSTDAGPVLDWFAQSTAENRRTRNVYVIVLRNDLPSPIAKESDEEKPKPEGGASSAAEASAKTAAAPSSAPPTTAPAQAPAPEVRIDFPGIEYRILDLPIAGGDLSSLQVGDAGQLFYLRTPQEPPSAGPGPAPAQGPRAWLHRFDLAKRQDEQLLDNVREYYVLRFSGRQETALRAARRVVDCTHRHAD